MEPSEHAVIGLECGVARAVRPVGEDVLDVDVSTTSGTTVCARAHSMLVGPIRPGTIVTIASHPARRGSADLGALVVGAGDLSTLPSPTEFAGMPVVVAADAGSAAAAAAGARVAGARGVREERAAPGIWPRLMASAAEGAAEVFTISGARAGASAAASTGSLLEGCRLLGTRPVAALTLARVEGILHVGRESLEALRDHCGVDVDVAVPVPGDPAARGVLWNDLREERLEERHHLVEVDAGAARASSPRAVRDLGAAAAGVLAGRMAVGARRWRRTP